MSFIAYFALIGGGLVSWIFGFEILAAILFLSAAGYTVFQVRKFFRQ